MHEGPSAAVVGAGLAGLAAAHRLARAGWRVRVYEAGEHAGGVVRSAREGGFLAECGPNSMADPPPAARALIRELGIEGRLVPTGPEARVRYVVRQGRPVPLPTSPPALLATKLFSLGGRLRLLREPFVRPAPPGADESVAAWARRRLGGEALEYAVEPFVAGVYAGDPDKLSIRHALPRLKAMEDAHGSLLRAAARMAKERGSQGGVKASGASYSFPEGMGELPAALAASLGDALRTRTAVRALRRGAGGGWEAGVFEGGEFAWERHDAVVWAAPTHALAGLRFDGEDALGLRALSHIPYLPIAAVVLGFRRGDVAHPLDGFGMLVPRVERRRILGTLFSSTLFPSRAPEGHVALTTFVGGAREPALAALDEESLFALVRQELRDLLGVRGEPVFQRRHAWTRAIPQYVLGYGELKARMDALEYVNPGLFLAGSYRTGPSVGDTLTSGLAAADRALALLGASADAADPDLDDDAADPRGTSADALGDPARTG